MRVFTWSIYPKIILVIFVLTCVTKSTFSKSMILKISLYDCSTCYYGITILQDSLLGQNNHIYLFESRYQTDSSALIDKFNINRTFSTIIYSDSLYRLLGKTRMSELIIADSGLNIQESIPIAKIEKSSIKLIRTMMEAKDEVPSNIIIDYLPADYTFKGSSDQLIVKSQIDNSYTIYKRGNLKYIIKLNIDSIYHQIQSLFPLIDNGYDYKKYISNDVSMKPQLNYMRIVDDSISYGFATIFYIDRYDSVLYNDYIAKKELFVLKFVFGKIVNIYRIDQSKLFEKGYGINEYGNFHMSNQYFYFSIGNINKLNDPLSSCVARYKFRSNFLEFESITKIKPSQIYQSHHPAFHDKSILADDEIITMPFSNVLTNIRTNEQYELPLNKTEIINNNPQFVNYGIWDILKQDKKILLIYSFKRDIYVGQFDTENSSFLTRKLTLKEGGTPALTRINDNVYILHIQQSTRKANYIPLDYK